MSIELQNAYAVSQATTDYDRDYERIAAFRDSGFFVVAAKSPAYCRHTDALLPNSHRSFASSHLTRELAEVAAHDLSRREAEDGGDSSYSVLEPTMTRNRWLAAVASFSSEMRNLDIEDTQRSLAKRLPDLEHLLGEGVAPAVAAAEMSRNDEHFDYDAWVAANRPALPESEPDDEMPMPF